MKKYQLQLEKNKSGILVYSGKKQRNYPVYIPSNNESAAKLIIDAHLKNVGMASTITEENIGY